MSGKVLTFYVHDFSGPVAATRRRGRIAAENLERLAATHQGMVEVNFTGVETTTGPFMQEIVRVVLQLKDRAIYSCLSEDVRVVLDLVEARLSAANDPLLRGEEGQE